jgi:hypothetical protein
MQALRTWLKLSLLTLGLLLFLGAEVPKKTLHVPTIDPNQPIRFKSLDLEVISRGPAAPATYVNKKHGLSFTLPAGWIREDSNRVGTVLPPPGGKDALEAVASFYRKTAGDRMLVFHLGVFRLHWVDSSKTDPNAVECSGKRNHDLKTSGGLRRRVLRSCRSAYYSYSLEAEDRTGDATGQQQELDGIIDSVRFSR